MKEVFFTDCELKELESIKILGGNSDEVKIQNQCPNNVDGCGAGTIQNQCTNTAQCTCVIPKECPPYTDCTQKNCNCTRI